MALVGCSENIYTKLLIIPGKGVRIWILCEYRWHIGEIKHGIYLTALDLAWAGYRSRYSYWLRAGRSGDRIPLEARFSAPVQTVPGAHPVSCTMGTGSFPGVKSGRAVTLTRHPLPVPWSWKSRAIPLLPLWAIRPVQSLSGCTRVTFTFLFFITFNICSCSSRTLLLSCPLSAVIPLPSSPVVKMTWAWSAFSPAYIAKIWEWVAQHLHTPMSSRHCVLGGKQNLFVKFNSYIKWQGVQKSHSRVLAAVSAGVLDKSLARPDWNK